MVKDGKLKWAQEDNALCLSEYCLQHIKAIKGKPCLIAGMYSEVVEINLDRRSYWCDKVTGSLYDMQTLRCLTGDLTIEWAEVKKTKRERPDFNFSSGAAYA